MRLVFTCCHPALAIETQVALTLRMVGGLKTDEASWDEQFEQELNQNNGSHEQLPA